MKKLGLLFNLGTCLEFAACNASVNNIPLATNALEDVLQSLFELKNMGIAIDSVRIQDMLKDGQIYQSIIEDVRDNDYSTVLKNIHPVFYDAYALGVNISGAEGQARSGDENARLVISGNVAEATNLVNSLNKENVPLALANLPADLQTIHPMTDDFKSLYSALVYNRGKCQGVLDVVPDPV